jgi:hypothetical protein
VQNYQLAESAKSSAVPFETHVFWFKGPRSARAASYRWTPKGNDAGLVLDPEIISLAQRKRHWFSPGFDENLNLDAVVAGFVLPMNVRQLNHDGAKDGVSAGLSNQLVRLEQARVARCGSAARKAAASPRPLEDLSSPAELRVRSYLDVNCSACHRPGGFARSAFDARFRTPLSEQGLINGPLIAGDLGIAGARVIVPGAPEKSVLYQRLRRNDFFRMPPDATTDEPTPLLPVLDQWIRSLR